VLRSRYTYRNDNNGGLRSVSLTAINKHIIGYLSGVTPALVGPLPIIVRRHSGSSPRPIYVRTFLLGMTGVRSHLRSFFWE
jgi:hypothetical protein